MTEDIKQKAQALAQELEMKDEERAEFMEAAEEQAEKDGTEWNAQGHDWLVLTDEEADEMAAERIRESVWAFTSAFIIEHSKALDFDAASEKIVKAIAEQCESGNEAMTKLIDSMDEFIEDAVSADGRGHFLSGYDGNEREQRVDGVDYYIYKQ